MPYSSQHDIFLWKHLVVSAGLWSSHAGFSARATQHRSSVQLPGFCGRDCSRAGRPWRQAITVILLVAVAARRWVPFAKLSLGLQVAKVQSSEHVGQSLTQSRQGLSVPFGHGLSRTSFDRRNGDLWRTEHPVIIPLVIAVRSLQCVALARVRRARSSHSTFHVTHRGHRVTCRNCRSGSWGRTLLSNQRQTLSTVGLECAKLLASNSWKNSWLGSSACALFLTVRLVPTPTNGCLTGRNC